MKENIAGCWVNTDCLGSSRECVSGELWEVLIGPHLPRKGTWVMEKFQQLWQILESITLESVYYKNGLRIILLGDVFLESVSDPMHGAL